MGVGHSSDVTNNNCRMAEVPPKAVKEKGSWVGPGVAEGQKIQERKVLPKAKARELTSVNKSHHQGVHTALECKQEERLEGTDLDKNQESRFKREERMMQVSWWPHVSRGEGKPCLLIQCISFSSLYCISIFLAAACILP